MRVLLQLPGDQTIAVQIPGTPDLSTIGPFEDLIADDGTLVLRYLEALSETTESSAPDKLCGEVLIPFRTREGRAAVYTVSLPPPDPFTDSALQTMWDEVGALGLDLEGGLDLQGALHAPAIFVPLGNAPRDSEVLVRLIGAGRQLLAEWPQEGTAVEVWRPSPVPGGIENAVLTIQRGWQARWGLTHGTPYPERSARRAMTSDDWRLAGLSHVSTRVANALRGEESLFSGLFSQIAVRAAPADPQHVDPAPSSWPHALLEFSQLAWRFLHQSRAREQGRPSGSVRLCRVWDLYERWVAAEAVRCVTHILDMAPRIRRGRGSDAFSWCAEWAAGEMRVQIDSQHHFKAMAGAVGWSHGYRSVTADLKPDALVVLDRGGGQTSLLLIDAKERGVSFGRDAAAATAAKYLWGLRDPAGMILDEVAVVLATSRQIDPSVFDEELSRMRFIHTLPSHSDDLLLAIRAFIEGRGAL